MSIIAKLQKEKEKSLSEISSVKSEKQRREKYLDMQRKYFQNFDNLLHKSDNNNKWLSKPEIASIVKEAIESRDGKEYELISYVIMPNHVHMVIIPRNSEENTKTQPYKTAYLLKSLKWFTAMECNKKLKRKGAFWQHESYDHVVRNVEELKNIVLYISNNPVKAGLVERFEEYQWLKNNYSMFV
jgi:REP element-mobilizing transposase RayT